MKKSAAGEQVDRISELPDEIVHSILRCIPCYKEIARTSLLSRRWRYLYGSYPFVESDFTLSTIQFRKLSEATMKRFSRHKLLRMKSLKIFVNDTSQAAEQLLDLASKRKAEYVEVSSFLSFFLCILPLQILSNSSARFLSLNSVRLFSDKYDLLLSLNSLRSLHLNRVSSNDERIFTNLIASSPVLETLSIEYVSGMEKVFMPNRPASLNFAMKSLRFLQLRLVYCGGERGLLNLITSCPLLETLELQTILDLRKLHISNHSNLKTLKIFCCDVLGVVEITAPELQSFQLLHEADIRRTVAKLSKVELIAPQLKHSS
ncbi:F-box/FBD/LRR-repeat protein At5g53840 [Linum perenne]